MNVIKRKVLLFFVSLCAILSFVGLLNVEFKSAKTVKAESATVFEMMDGAGLRVLNPTGLRFKAKIGSDYYNELIAANTTTELHIMVIPYSYYSEYAGNNGNDSTNLYPYLVSKYGVANVLDLKIPAANVYAVDDYYCANAVISNVNFNNYHEKFVGAAYIRRGTSGNYTYQDVVGLTEQSNARSVFYVANKASENPSDYATYADFLDDAVEKGLYRGLGVQYNKETGKYLYNGSTYNSYAQMKAAVNIDFEGIVVSVSDSITINAATESKLTAVVTYPNSSEFQEDAVVTWSSEDESIVTVDSNGVLTPKGIGSATVSVSAIGGRFTDTCTVTVVKAANTIDTGYTFLVKGDASLAEANTNTGDAVIDLTETGINGNAISAVTCNGNAVTIKGKTETSITLTNAPAGDGTYTLTTPIADYVISGCVYGYEIKDLETLEYYRNNNVWKYTVLTGDINLENETLAETATFIRGTFDGRGHTISNFTIKKSLFGNIYANTGAVKNLSLVNVTQDLSEATTNVNYGFIAQTCQAAITIENVYIQGKITGLNSSYRVWAVLVNSFGDNSVIRNVILNIESECTGYHTIVNMAAIPSGATVSGVYVVFKNSSGAWAEINNNISLAAGVYSSVPEMGGAVDFSSWGGYWNLDVYGAPYMGEPRQSITIEGVFYAQGNASMSEQNANTGTATIDLSSTGYDFSGTMQVSCGGSAVTLVSSTSTSVTINNAPAGDGVYIITTPEGDYTVNVCVYVYGISDASTLNTWRNTRNWKYAILLNDIDLVGATLDQAEAAAVNGVLDGRGYAISNFTINGSNSFVASNFQASATIKNIQFIDVTHDCTSFGTGNVNSGIITQTLAGTIENVYLQANVINLSATQHMGVFLYNGAGTIRNVIVKLTSSNANVAHYPIWNPSGILNNLHFIYGGTIGGLHVSWATPSQKTNCGTYAGDSALAAADLSSFEGQGYWIVEENDIPYMGDKEQSVNVAVSGVFYAQGDATLTDANANIGNATIDFSDTEVSLEHVKSVTYGNGTVASFSVNGDVLTLVNPAAGDNVYFITTRTRVYKINICVYRYEISDLATLNYWRNNTIWKYTILRQNLDLGGATLATAEVATLRGTLDGRGYTISNFTVETSFVNYVSWVSGIKNLKLSNVTHDATGAAANIAYGILAGNVGGVIENVLIEGNITNLPSNIQHSLLCRAVEATAKINNVILRITSDGTSVHHIVYGAPASGAQVDYVYLVLDSTGTPHNTTGATHTGVYLNDEAMVAANDFSDWGNPWEINEDGIPYIGEYVKKNIISLEEVLYAQGNGATNVAAAPTGTASVNFSGTEISLGTVSRVYYDNDTAVSYSVNGNTLILTNAPAGEKVYTIYTNSGIYKVNICVYVTGISTKSELIAYREATNYSYAVLLNDLDLEGEELSATSNYLRGTLDGRGHTISNFTVTQGLFGNIYATGAVKNLQIINVVQDCSAATSPAMRYGIVAQTNNGTIENVLIVGKVENLAEGVAHWGLVCYNTGSADAAVRNVIVKIDSNGTARHMVANFSQGTVDNVYMILGNQSLVSKSAVTDLSYATNVGVYTTESKLLAAVDFSSWEEPWIIEESKIPYMSEYLSLLGFTHRSYVGTTEYKLFDNGTSDYLILVPYETRSLYYPAKDELVAILGEATGFDFSSRWTADNSYDAGRKYISIGDTDLLAKSGITVDYDLLGEQGYQIETVGQNIYICGNPTGALYGVYDLMNKLVGFEQYTSAFYNINSVTTIDLPDLFVQEVPDIEFRITPDGELTQYVTAVNSARKRMRLSNSDIIVATGGGAHNVTTSVVPYSEFSSTHPDWFYSNKQLCYTARGNVTEYTAMVNEAVDNIKALLLAEPSKKVFTITQMDTRSWCNCSACSALKSAYGTDAASQIKFVNDVVGIINEWLENEQGGREVQFAIFAYYTTATAPAVKDANGMWQPIDSSVVLRDNISIWIAAIEDDFRKDIYAADNGNMMRGMIESWSACASSYFIWAYDAYFNNYTIPYNTFDAMPDLISFCAEYKTKYMYIQGPHDLTQNTGFGDLKSYLYSKLMWNSSLDADVLTEKYFNAVYKEAAVYMKQVYNAWKEKSATFGGNIYSSADSWRELISDFNTTWLTTQLGKLENAITAISSYESSDPDLYGKIYDSIVSESLGLRYIYKQRNSREYSSSKWGTFASDAARLGFNRYAEGKNL